MRIPIAVLLLLTPACSASHEPSGDADAGALDAGPSDADVPHDANLPDGLAPRCAETPIAPCLELASSATIPTGESRPGGSDLDGTLHGLAYVDVPVVLYTHRFDDGPTLPASPARWAIQRLTSAGAPAGGPMFLGDAFVRDSEWGGDLGVGRGQLVAGWRQPRYDTGFTPPAIVGFDSFVVRGDGAPVGPMQPTSLEEAAEGGGDVAVATGLVITAVAGGLLINRDDGTGAAVLVSTDEPPVGEIRSVEIAPGRALVVWSEDHAPGLAMDIATEAAIVTDAGVEARTRVFAPSAQGGTPSVVILDDEIWLARYDADLEHLRESRIRVAHLDASLTRLGSDRWFGGWGGLTPSGMSLVAWRAVPWLIWRTLDARYGANTVLYARPIPEPECGFDVSDPASVWGAGLIANRLFAASSDDAIWVAVPQISGPGTADVYQFRACE